MIERIAHLGWPNCPRAGNGVVELIATTDVGPRIIHFGFTGGPNLFKVFDRDAGKTGGEEWRIYGGHRLWHAPERKPWTYAPDNDPIEWRCESDHALILTQRAHPLTQISKTIRIALADLRPEVSIVHRLTNEGNDPVELAAWALTALAPGGVAILPVPEPSLHDDAHLLPAGAVVFWPYTNLADPRLSFAARSIRVQQDRRIRAPFKLGLASPANWCAYLNEGIAFIKRFQPLEGAIYPDQGAQIEVFTDSEMLELETLGPLVTLRRGESVEHVENWSLQHNFDQASLTTFSPPPA